MNIRGIFTYIKNNPGRLISGAVGLVGLGVVAYDSHNLGKIQSDLYASGSDANHAAYYLNNDMYVTSMSRTQEKVRDLAFRTELGQGWRRFINTPIGYLKGFFTMMISEVVPLGLSVGAIAGKGKVGKGCAIGLVAYGAIKGLRNFFGFSTPGSIIK